MEKRREQRSKSGVGVVCVYDSEVRRTLSCGTTHARASESQVQKGQRHYGSTVERPRRSLTDLPRVSPRAAELKMMWAGGVAHCAHVQRESQCFFFLSLFGCLGVANGAEFTGKRRQGADSLASLGGRSSGAAPQYWAHCFGCACVRIALSHVRPGWSTEGGTTTPALRSSACCLPEVC